MPRKKLKLGRHTHRAELLHQVKQTTVSGKEKQVLKYEQKKKQSDEQPDLDIHLRTKRR